MKTWTKRKKVIVGVIVGGIVYGIVVGTIANQPGEWGLMSAQNREYIAPKQARKIGQEFSEAAREKKAAIGDHLNDDERAENARLNEESLTRDYWAKALPIVKNQIEKSGRPFGELLVKIMPAMQSGDSAATEQFFLAVREYYPYVGEAVLQLTKLNSPTAATFRWQLAQLEAWSLRMEAFNSYMSCWDYNRRTYIGTDDDIASADKLAKDFQIAGKEADRLQAEMMGQFSKAAREKKAAIGDHLNDDERAENARLKVKLIQSTRQCAAILANEYIEGRIMRLAEPTPKETEASNEVCAMVEEILNAVIPMRDKQKRLEMLLCNTENNESANNKMRAEIVKLMGYDYLK